jgi:hypothetical protein
MMGEKGGYPFIGGERDDPFMQAGEVAVGMNVRYPRTGTTGKVVRIAQIDRDNFAELDTTHLLYRTDQLIPFEPKVQKEAKKGREDLEQIAKEREDARSVQSQWLSADELCDGGG